MNKKTLYGSIFLNVVLIVSLITVSIAGNLSKESSLETTGSDLGEKSLSSNVSGNDQSRTGKFLSNGLSESQLRMLRLQELKQEHINSIPAPTDYYWTPSPLKETADFLLMRVDGFKKIRQELVIEFGENAKSAPEFLEVFRPLAAQHDYLPSERQIALSEYQAKNQAQLMKNLVLPELGGATQMGMMASPVMKDNGLENILSSDMLFEYNLRTSPLSSRLRNTGLNLTEQQFRKVFAIFENNKPKDFAPSPDRRDILIAELNSLLGKEQAIKVVANLDPNFRPLKMSGAKNQLSEQQIYSAYEIFSETDREILEVYSLRQEDPIETNQRVQVAMKERRENLNNLIGEEAARDMLEMRQKFQQPIR